MPRITNEDLKRATEMYLESRDVIEKMEQLVITHMKVHECCKIDTNCPELGTQLFILKEPIIREMTKYSPSGYLEKDFLKDWNRRFLVAWRKANSICALRG